MHNFISPFYDVAIPITVYNLSFKINCHILSTELNYTFTLIFFLFELFLFIIYQHTFLYWFQNLKMQSVFDGHSYLFFEL